MLNTQTGSAREAVDPTEQENLRRIGALVRDQRRSRPNYFDGRFLTATDLTREQTYVLSRQADLAKASGSGVIAGLEVSLTAQGRASSVSIAAGYGLTPSGEMVVLPEDHEVNLADLAEIQQLNSAVGLSGMPTEPLRTATGLFVLGLRPVEFTADPIASYPTTPAGDRTVQDGFIVEATAITLIPYADVGNGDFEQRRSQVAHGIFVTGASLGALTPVLPLAMVALSRGVVQWVDVWLVRRELSSETRQILSLGGIPRSLREAQVQQYAQQLQSVIEQRQANNRSLTFSAAEHFAVLPPVGQLPSAAIQSNSSTDASDPNAPARFTQLFFPPEVEVDLSFIPEDELAAVVEDSLLLPPIDLTLTAEARDSVAVLVLIPVTRQRIQQLIDQLRLPDQPRVPPLRRTLLPAAPGQLAKRLPLEVLQGIRRPPLPPLALLNPQIPIDTLWRQELVNTPLLWFVRRRNFAYRSDFVQLQEVDA